MKAMQITGFGGPEVFRKAELPVPVPGPGQVQVRVYATSVNPVDFKIRRSGAWAGVQPPAVLGYDVSGVVTATGAGVRDFAPGDEVYYTPEIFGGGNGSYAEYHVASEAIVARKPAHLSHAEAASLPLAGGTAWDALVTRAALRVGETVLIHAGAGGVGSLAIQIARAAGARVLTTCSDYNFELVQRLGAHRAIDYREEDFVDVVRRETSGGVDLVLDTVGGDVLGRSVQAVRPHGRVVGIVGTNEGVSGAYVKNVTVHFLFLERARSKLDALRTLAERGALRPVLDSVRPLEQVADAHRRLEQGGVSGKIALQVTG